MSVIIILMSFGLKGMNVPAKHKPWLILYGIGVAFTLSKALWLWVDGAFYPMVTAGAALFLLSDTLLQFLYFSDKYHPAVKFANLLAYYGGMALLAAGMI